MVTGDRTEARAREVLAAPPRPPIDVSRFTSNVLFGQPGIYPDGPPMAPATDAPMAPQRIRSELHRLLSACATSPGASLDDASLTRATTARRRRPAESSGSLTGRQRMPRSAS